MLLHHGTTRLRAESIRGSGPDVDFVEPGESPQGKKDRQFHVTPATGPNDCGSPEEYARLKAKLFRNEGGPAILEFDVPDDLIGKLGNDEQGKACNWGSDIWFEDGFGLKELLDNWAELPKRVIALGD